MTSLTLGTDALSELDNVADVVEIRDTSGRVLGYFHPLRSPSTAASRSPFSDETLRQRQQQRTGKPLSDVLADLSSP
ncbi:MAG TPA: hypothetical protein VG125_01855 [Pirellulales bacterium]|jgi:hypothetical protein|nr:hypothetical protein [Pirellulales bacterium]